MTAARVPHHHDEIAPHDHSALTRGQLAEHEIAYHTWPPQAVRFRQWDFDRGVWYFTTKTTHAPRPDHSTLTVCGLDWFGNHTISTAGPPTCNRCTR